MGKWMPHDTQFRTEDDVFIAFKHSLDDEAVIAAHNADIDALTAERDEWKEKERITSELFEAACNDLGDAQEELAAAIEYAHSRDAERDELQRRIKSITEILTDLAGNPHAMLDAHEVLCVLAIAEGRTE